MSSSFMCSSSNCPFGSLSEIASIPQPSNYATLSAQAGSGLINVNGQLIHAGTKQSGLAGCGAPGTAGMGSGGASSGYALASLGFPASSCASFPLVCSYNQPYSGQAPSGWSCATTTAGLARTPGV